MSLHRALNLDVQNRKTCGHCGKTFGIEDVTWPRNFPRMKYCGPVCAHARKKFDDEQYIAAFWRKVVKTEGGCWLWQGAKKHDGYGLTNRNRKMMLAHRLAWELTNGPIPAGQCALHRCDTPACVNPAHIFLGTRKDNSADAISKLRHAWGERSIHAKLTEEQVLEIRRLRDEGLPRREIAERYGIRPDSVYLIASRRIWKHLP